MVSDCYRYDKPRLLGRLSYGMPYVEETIHNTDGLEIVPARLPRRLMRYLAMSGVMGVVVAWGFLAVAPRFPYGEFVVLLGWLWAIPLLAASGQVYHLFLRARPRGPILIVSRDKQRICLPRAAKSWDFGQIARWEIVCGTWVSDVHGGEQRSADLISELQLIVEPEPGTLVAWPVLGGMGQHDHRLLEVAKELSRQTNATLRLANV